MNEIQCNAFSITHELKKRDIETEWEGEREEKINQASENTQRNPEQETSMKETTTRRTRPVG